MKKYKVVNVDVMYNGRLYREGEIIEIDENIVKDKIGIIYEEIKEEFDNKKKKGEDK